MVTIKEIENSVACLPEDQLEEFRKWFEEFDAKIWDEQFERDVNEGKIDKLAEEALNDLDTGRCTPL